MFDHILPEETEEQKVTRAQEDKHAYCRGKSDARKQLSRDASVHYKDSRDKDCYNMGYSSGVYENNKVN